MALGSAHGDVENAVRRYVAGVVAGLSPEERAALASGLAPEWLTAVVAGLGVAGAPLVAGTKGAARTAPEQQPLEPVVKVVVVVAVPPSDVAAPSTPLQAFLVEKAPRMNSRAFENWMWPFKPALRVQAIAARIMIQGSTKAAICRE